MSKEIFSAGGRMKVRPKRQPIKWPDGARIAITPCVAFETWPEDLGGPNTLQQENRRSFPRNAVTKRNLAIITDREFGERVGIYRMLEVFESEKIQTSFFPTGITVQNYPEIFKEIAEQGHEVGTETWIHDYSYMKKPDQEKKDLKKTVEAVRQVVGRAPAGYLSTGVAPSASTPEIILELGYTYWMDPQHQETPYTLKIKKQELTVLSYFQDLNDYSSYQRAGRTPRDLLQMWKDCFDCLYEEGERDPKFMMWGNHPFVGGRPFRALLLREFIRYAKSHGKVWFAPAGEIAKWYRENYHDAQVEEWPNFAHAGRPGKISDLTKL
jgi:peptidoglycan/xylan/chitin deacetylase (PgdA/CDA1 family)